MYNPFGKDIDKLVAEDLLKLRDVQEGWFVEYKSKPDEKNGKYELEKIAKSISSFANGQGGWLVYGIKESKEHTAGEFSGIPDTDSQRLFQAISDAATTHLNPTPLYSLASRISDPNEVLGLPEGRFVQVVFIPPGNTPPYIHSSGQIFIRRGDKSNQTEALTHRHDLDQLYAKAKETRERQVRFLNSSIEEKGQPDEAITVHLYILTNPHFDKRIQHCNFQDFSQVMTGHRIIPGQELAKIVSYGLSYRHSGTFSKGYFAGNGRLFSEYKNLLKYFNDGNFYARYTLPLTQVGNLNNDKEFSELIQYFSKYDYSCAYFERLRDRLRHLNNVRFFDLDNLFAYFCATFHQIHMLLSILNSPEIRNLPLHARCVIKNTYKAIPYFDIKSYGMTLIDNRIPIVNEDSIELPGLSNDLFSNLPPNNDEQVFDPRVPAMALLLQILQACGVCEPIELLKERDNETELLSKEIGIGAFFRFMDSLNSKYD